MRNNDSDLEDNDLVTSNKISCTKYILPEKKERK